jgi:hypothetical protein
MLKRGLTLCLVLGVASVANAGAVLDIQLDTPENGPGGYLPGTTVDFSVFMSTDAQMDIEARLITIGFHVTDPALTFVGTEFDWDWSTVMFDFGYTKFLEYPRVNVTYSSTEPQPGLILVIPQGGALRLGGGQVVAPMELGTYMLDGLNELGLDYDGQPGNANHCARLDFDFVNPTVWTAINGDVTGGRTPVNVVPEPATLALLALGGVAALRRRRS